MYSDLIFFILFLLSPVTAAPGKDLISGQHLNLTCSSSVPLTSDLRLKWIPPKGSSLQPPTSDHLSIPMAGPGDSGMWRCELRRNNTLLTTATIALKIGECRKCVCVWREEEGRKSNMAVTSLLYHIQSLIVCLSALQQSPFWVCGCWWSSAAPQPSSSSSSSSSASSSVGADERRWALPLCWSVVVGATRRPFHPPHCVFIVFYLAADDETHQASTLPVQKVWNAPQTRSKASSPRLEKSFEKWILPPILTGSVHLCVSAPNLKVSTGRDAPHK